MLSVSGGNVIPPSVGRKNRSAVRYLAVSAKPYIIGFALIVIGQIVLALPNGAAGLVRTTSTTFAVNYPSLLVDLPGMFLTVAGIFYIGYRARRDDKYFRNATLKKNIEVVTACVLGSVILTAFGASLGYAAQNQRVTDWGAANFGIAHFNDLLPAPIPVFNGGIAPNIPWFGSSDVTYTVDNGSGHNLRLHYVSAGNGSYALSVTR